MKKMKTIDDITISEIDFEKLKYNYNPELTAKLDNLDTDFNQEIINEIVLWKVNRYALLDDETMGLLNKIKKSDTVLNDAQTREVLLKLLNHKGIRLPMASTILRFKNPKIYQIIDQRVYRFICGEELKYSLTDLNKQIDFYMKYLVKLREVCDQNKLDFEKADRWLYTLDKLYNPAIKLRGY